MNQFRDKKETQLPIAKEKEILKRRLNYGEVAIVNLP